MALYRIVRDFLLVLLILSLHTAHSVNIRSWKTMSNMKDVREMVRVNHEIWSATSGGLLILDMQTHEFRSITNTEGLEEINVVCIEYDKRGYIWCALSNGLIQIYDLETNTWQFYRGFENQYFINDISVHNGFVLIGFDNGIAQLQLDAINRWELYWIAEIGDVQVIYNNGETIWIAQNDRVRKNETSFPNLQIPSSWVSYSTDDFFHSGRVLDFYTYDSVLYVGTNSGLYQFSNDNWDRIAFEERSVSSLGQWNDRLCAVTEQGIYHKGEMWESITTDIRDANDQVSDEQGTLWLSRPEYGFVALSDTYTRQDYVPNGPSTNSFNDMIIDQDGHLWTASANGAVNYFNGFSWKTFNKNNGLPSNDYRAIEIDENNTIWAGSWGGGVTRFDKVTRDSIVVTHLGAMDGMLAGIPSNTDYVVIRDILCDDKNNLWFLNYLAENKKVLGVLEPQGQWQHWTTLDGIVSDEISRLEIDDSQRIWIGTDDAGVSVLDYGESLQDKSDDDLSGFLNNTEGLESNVINAMAYDLDGTMWIGTLEGLNYWFAGSVSTKYNVINDVINAILVDPRNNKWFGTKGGLSVMQFDGMTWDHYSTNDSPLVSNNVTCFALNKNTGELYIGTTNGLSVLETPFTQPEETLDQVVGYPNPYILDSADSFFYIDKLAANSAIKIFTSEGRLIRTIDKDQVLGAQALWDGKNDNGQKVTSGIYVYLITAENGEHKAGKVAVITP